MKSVSFSMDGKKITCTAGTSILAAARQNKIHIPTLCDHPDLSPYGACRLCIVEDEKSGRLVASCVTPAAQEMAVQTRSDRVLRHRRNIVRMMMAEHPESCIVCNKGNRCELRQIAAELGIGATGLHPMPNVRMVVDVNPFIVRDLSKCILCGKCIRADHELVVAGAIDYHLRGFPSRPATLHNTSLENSSCTFCGTCVTMCPTGALSTRFMDFVGTPEREAGTICSFCGVGCELSLGIQGNQVVDVTPAPGKNTVNRSSLCVRGHFAHDFLNSPARLHQPLRRVDGQLLPDTWETCLDEAAARLLKIKKEHGPQSIGVFGAACCSNEENFLLQKIARVALGTNNIDNGAYFSGRTAANAMDDHLENGGRHQRLADLETAEAILVAGANPCHSSPVAGYHILRAARKGTPLIVVDPRSTELSRRAALWLPIAPGGDLDFLSGLAAALYRMQAHQLSFIDRFTKGFGMYRYGLQSINLQQVEQRAGLAPDSLSRAAELLRGKKIAFVIGNGIFQQPSSLYCVNALLNLALMTGSLGAPGTGFYRISRYSNQMGAVDMGSAPDHLPGRQRLKKADIRAFFEKAWNSRISPDRGLNIIRMIEEAEKGNLKALYVCGENPVRDLPQADRVRKALENLELLVVQDILDNETVRLATIVLPGAAQAEKGGSLTTMEGRIQAFEPAVAPPGGARPDWQILAQMAERLGMTDRYDTPDRIQSEIRRLVPGYHVKNGDTGTAVQETSRRDLFTGQTKGRLITFLPVASQESRIIDSAFSHTAILGTIRFHLGGGTRTAASRRVSSFAAAEAFFSSADAGALGLEPGDQVKIQSPAGWIRRSVAIEQDLPKGRIFIPLAVSGNDAMQLIPFSPLGRPEEPGWKTCPVQIEKIPAA